MALLDLLGRRWTLRLLWELRDEELSFTQLQTRCGGISPSVLSTRLRELEAAGMLGRKATAYALTAEGGRLGQILLELDGWAKRWARRAGTSDPRATG